MNNVHLYSATFENTTFKRSSICQKVPALPSACMEVSILSYWFAGDSSKIGEEIDATADILAHINEKRKNPSLADIDSILGGVKSNPDDNSVISGTALKVLFLNELSENFTKDAHSAWEQQFLYYINNLTVSLIQNQKSQCSTSFFAASLPAKNSAICNQKLW